MSPVPNGAPKGVIIMPYKTPNHNVNNVDLGHRDVNVHAWVTDPLNEYTVLEFKKKNDARLWCIDPEHRVGKTFLIQFKSHENKFFHEWTISHNGSQYEITCFRKESIKLMGGYGVGDGDGYIYVDDYNPLYGKVEYDQAAAQFLKSQFPPTGTYIHFTVGILDMYYEIPTEVRDLFTCTVIKLKNGKFSQVVVLK